MRPSTSSGLTQGPLAGGLNWLLSQYGFSQPSAKGVTLRCFRLYSMLSYRLTISGTFGWWNDSAIIAIC